ncbi:hypothetical protein [Halobacterium sp. CBA1126]|uniref:hypothetical protein n=1 Tax=Halobacterium TaxID=2239 RepID=UPI0012FC0A0F|nr:hypothetical protein [Halobacterium sp. CBA1126]MUV60881.1 hypothetical protein [Halobacterium sp. CBA1126]
MTPTETTDRRSDSVVGELRRACDPEELRRRNSLSLGMDALILFTTGFLAILFTMGAWPSAIAAVPTGALLYFGWSSSRAFFVAQLLAVAVVVLATVSGLLPY